MLVLGHVHLTLSYISQTLGFHKIFDLISSHADFLNVYIV